MPARGRTPSSAAPATPVPRREKEPRPLAKNWQAGVPRHYAERAKSTSRQTASSGHHIEQGIRGRRRRQNPSGASGHAAALTEPTESDPGCGAERTDLFSPLHV